MRGTFLSIFILIAMAGNIAVAAKEIKYNLKEKLEVYDLFQKVQPLLFQNDKTKTVKSFQHTLAKLDKDKRQVVLSFIKKFDRYFPEVFLKAITYHRFIQYDQGLLEDILTYYMMSKVMVVRDFVHDNPDKLKTLRDITGHKKATPYNLEGLMLPLYREKARAISQMTAVPLFEDALRNTSLVTIKLQHYIGQSLPLHLDIFGAIPGNTLSQVDSLFKTLKEAKSSLWIDPHFVEIIRNNKKFRKWVLNHPNKDFKVFISFDKAIEEKTRSFINELKEQWGARLSTYQTQKLKNHPRAKSRFHHYYDHAELIIADGLTPYAFAIYGRGFSYKIKGPAAQVLQALYIKEVEYYTGTLWPYELSDSLFMGEGVPLRLGFNDGVERNNGIRDLILSSFITAKKSIYIDQSFLYDPLVVDTLIKVKIRNPKLEVRALIDMTQSFEMNGLPNSMFIEELKKYGIQIRTRKSETPSYNAISIDSTTFLWGSTSITPDSMDGLHREILLKVSSPEIVHSFEENFNQFWRNPSLVFDLDIENFKVKIDGKVLRSPSSQVINDMGAKLLKNKSFIIR